MNATKSYSWSELEILTQSLSAKLIDSLFYPDIILGIARGGCFPALLLSHLMNIRTLYTIQISTTVDETIRAKRCAPNVQTPFDLEALDNKNILIIDDVSNTGKTMQAAYNKIKTGNPRQVKTACIVWDKVGNENYCKVDYYATEINAWVIFPWETLT